MLLRGDRPTRLVLAVLGGLLAAGCAGIPTSGEVTEGRAVLGEDEAPYVGIIPAGPRPGDSEQQIVEGFLLALTAYQPGHPVARSFLTPEAEVAWQPDAGILVYEAGSEPVRTETGQVSFSSRQWGSVGPEGAYQRAAPNSSLDLTFQLRRIGEEWRIANPPPGLALPRADFQREYQPYQVFFFDPGFEVLVPQTVHLPVRGNVTTPLVRALLAGPSSWLAPAVRTAFPEETTLTLSSVPTTSGIATVALSEEASSASPDMRVRMSAQLAATLKQDPGVDGLRLTVGGSPLAVPEVVDEGVQTLSRWDRFDAGIASTTSQFYALSPTQPAVLEGLQLRPSPRFDISTVPVRDIAVDLTGGTLAGSTADGRVVLFRQGQPPLPVHQGTDVTAMSWDRGNRLWIADASRGGTTIWVYDGRSPSSRQVDAPALAGLRVTHFEIARDGVRLAVVTTAGSTESVALGWLLRETVEGSSEERLSVGTLRPLLLPLSSVRDVAWESQDRLAVLGVEPPAAVPSVYLVEPEGAAFESLGSVPAPEALAASPGQPLILGTAALLYRLDASEQWVEIGAGHHPQYPG